MGYFDQLTESAFKETEDGLCVYYPNGIISKGRIVPTQELKAKIYSFHKANAKYGILGVIVILLFLKKYALVFAFIYIPLHYYFRHKLIGNLEIHESRISINEIYRKVNVPNWYKNALLIVSMLGLFLTAPSIFSQHSYTRINVLLFGLSVFCLSAYFYIKHLDKKNKI